MSLLGRDEDTICAVATPPGKGGISVIRVSGKAAYPCVRKLCAFLPESPESHKVHYGLLKNQESDIDEVLVTYFEKGRSFTGEETVEISTHGSPTITSMVLSELNQLGARMAEPGEFTYRAFMSGRIDLVQAEGVLSVIESQSPRANRLALKQLQGHNSSELKEIEDELTWVLAHCEANIDFAAEDIETASSDQLTNRLLNSQKGIQKLISGYKIGKGIQEGLFISLLGYPNVGKSSLLNRFVGFDRAIVTEVPGTTRDVVEESVWYQGFKLVFSDTAGVREATDQVERLGIQRSLDMVDQADKVLLVLDSSEPFRVDPSLKGVPALKNKLVVLFNKSDQSVHNDSSRSQVIRELETLFDFPADKEIPFFEVSAKDETGLEEVLGYLVKEYQEFSESQESAIISNARHRELLDKSAASVAKALSLIGENQSPEFVAFELQTGLMAIQEILGKKFDDEVMDRVFKEFCLGK